MIKASDLPVFQPDQSGDLAAIEQHIDQKIRLHVGARRPWPMVVPTTRCSWTAKDIDTVLRRYRENGWGAMLGGRSAMCVLAPACDIKDLDAALFDHECRPGTLTDA